MPPKSIPERLVISFPEFYRNVYPCSRGHALAFVNSGELETFVDGGRRKILVEKAREFVARKAAACSNIEVSPEVRAQRSAAGTFGRAIGIKLAKKRKKAAKRTSKAAA